MRMTVPQTTAEFNDWRGRRVVDTDGRYVGVLDEIYLDDDGNPTRWAVLDTGVGPQPRSFFPLTGAELQGDEVRLSHSRDQVIAAASIEPDGELTASEEERLELLYGLKDAYEMIRSEEELRISTERRSAGRVRLRKVIVTEDVTVNVTVRREELRLEPVPADAADTAPLTGQVPATLDESGQTLYEVTLYEEVPVVETRVVPRERISVRKVVLSEERAVTESLRSEQVDLVDDRPTATRSVGGLS
jgi:uncharacterized protein (TIGR02271 family)